MHEKTPKLITAAAHDPVLAERLISRLDSRLKNFEFVVGALNRYNVRPGRIFGKPSGRERYRIIDISGNAIYYKDLIRDKVEYSDINDLLERWNREGIKELTPIDKLLDDIKKYLTPFLGGALVGALISWLVGRLK